jgi:acyl carrier protein
MNITETIKAKLTNNGKGGDWTNFSDDDSLWEEGILDSLGMIELIHFIERTFNIKVGEDDLSPDNFDSINRISRYISVKMNVE